MKKHADIQSYVTALSRALTMSYPVDYPTILGIAQDKVLQLEKDGKITSLSVSRPLIRKAIINAVINESVKRKRFNELVLPSAVVFSGEEGSDPDAAMANAYGDDSYENNPPEQCDWKDFVNTVLTRSERMIVDLITEMPEAFRFTGNSVKELRGAMRRYLKGHGMPEATFWRVQSELHRKLSERKSVRRNYA